MNLFGKPKKTLELEKDVFENLRILWRFIYTSMFFHERKSMSFCNFISQEMGLDRGAQDAGMGL